MVDWKKALIVAGVVCAVGLTANLAKAGCGHCGGDAGHTHEKKAADKVSCVKCDHAKACSAEDCTDAAHAAACICVKKASCAKCDHAKACSAEGCEDAAHSAECVCPAKDEAA